MRENWTPKPLKQVRRLLDGGLNVAPLVLELPADTWTPVGAFLRLAQPDRPAFLLESVEGGEHMARYSFLGVKPFQTLFVQDGRVIRRREDGVESFVPGSPFSALGDCLSAFRSSHEPGLPRFCGGAVGTVSYEMIRHIEPSVRVRPAQGPEARLMLFKNIAAFDHLRHRVLLIANVVREGNSLSKSYREACDALDDMRQRLSRSADLPPRPLSTASNRAHASLLGGDAFLEGVLRLKRHIRAGDIFQAVLSERRDVPVRAEPFSVYRALRALNPSPYMFFVDSGSEAALGASPEMLARVEDGSVETRPIAGTRPRGKDEEDDRRLERNLLASAKERAEHLMLVDLGRNDVGRVSRPGSVRVPSFMQVERYSHVMHLVSSVRGRLRTGVGPWDALASCFPAGTVSGAPKIRAMQLLCGIEPAPRGLYAGAVVCCDFRGNLDSAIAIRSLCMRRTPTGRLAQVQAGAGIVADSRPERELAEIRSKSQVLAEALRAAQAP